MDTNAMLAAYLAKGGAIQAIETGKRATDEHTISEAIEERRVFEARRKFERAQRKATN